MRGPIVITGFMGCGKSNVADALAQRLKLVMVDLDEMITARQGRTPAALINEDGERAFRSIETELLHQLLESGDAGIIALGGGAWIEKANRDLIDRYSCVSVWLDVPFEVCWERIESSTEERPLGKTKDQARALYAHRKPIYELSAVHVSAGNDETLDTLVARIEADLAQ